MMATLGGQWKGGEVHVPAAAWNIKNVAKDANKGGREEEKLLDCSQTTTARKTSQQ
jgi:hypothetical protein